MKNPPIEKLQIAAESLLSSQHKIQSLSSLVGFDGFVDKIIRIVDKREAMDRYVAIPTITAFAERIGRAAGKSTNLEMAVQQTKLGGNGPILANALATFGLQTTCIGNLGLPEPHPVFEEFSRKATLLSVAEPALTLALEFDDGKIMVGHTESMQEMTYGNIMKHLGEERFRDLWQHSDLISVNNWTMLLPMTELWQKILHHHCDRQKLSRQSLIYFDLCDPEKRPRQDILTCLETISQFSSYFRVFLSCNEKESVELATVLNVPVGSQNQDDLCKRAAGLREAMRIDGIVLHPVNCAIAATRERTEWVPGPYTANPRISTGAGDHFNAGYCLAATLGMDVELALLTGVATSGYYVRNAVAPTVTELAGFLLDWGRQGEKAEDKNRVSG